jgi:predicted Zn-dependent protease
MAAAVLALVSAPTQAGGLKGLFTLSKSQEAKVAQDMHEQYVQDPGLITRGRQYDEVQRIGRRLVERNKLTGYEYKFFLVDSKEVNAFATPGGYVYVHKGLVDLMGYDESMLAGIIAHELGHAKDRHVAKAYEKQMQGSIGVGLLGTLFGGRGEEGKVFNAVVQNAGGLMFLKYGRDQEEWADRAGVTLAYGAGYDAYGLARSLQALEALYGSSAKIPNMFENHPPNASRISRTIQIGKETAGRGMGYMSVPQPPQRSHPLWKLYGSGGSERGKLVKSEQQAVLGDSSGDDYSEDEDSEDDRVRSVPVEEVRER